ncbi:MAG: response regulator transcription factor [Cyclobacteriaceae bacterium]|nr:response regulator transcription factor [Cyclobacteriaceae bacterium]
MNTKLKCLLLDDELPGLTYLKMLCEQIPGLEIVKTFNSPALLLEEQQELEFDLCILDIQMPEANGLEIAAALKDKAVIFVTAYKEYAADAFDLNAVDYVRKPVSLERLREAVSRVRQKQSAELSFIQINTDKGKARIQINQLVYIKASAIDSRDKVACFADGTSFVLKNISFEKLLEKLPEKDFVRINKKEAIAVKSVQLFSSDAITLNVPYQDEPLSLILSDTYRKDFIRKVKI